MQLDPVQIVLGLGTPPAVAYVLTRTIWPRSAFYRTWFTSAIGGMIGTALPPTTPDLVAANGASLIIAAVLWWLSRRRRKRAPKLAGAKSRALLAAVVRTMRERSKPRPVFRPAPGGARA